ncbi:unnamed protein product [Fusarium graminearum]|nr:unnamed protein product [Fusarium graminearum]CAF3665203.1 unnamed protein product [Fusarium graminearum]CAG1960023.1 unnamed protein product [Fusarium graminearum]VTO84327.1 unnamed protein product [Fusarium graminearum]
MAPKQNKDIPSAQRRKCKTHLFQLNLSTPSAVCIRVQASGEQGPHSGGIHGEWWIYKRSRRRSRRG